MSCGNVTNRNNQDPFLGVLLFLLLWATAVQSQTPEQIKGIRQASAIHKLESLGKVLKEEDQHNQLQTARWAQNNRRKLTDTLQDGGAIALQEIAADGTPLYYETFSQDASEVTRANFINAQALHQLSIDGAGMRVGVWDAGTALVSHREYGQRAVNADGSAEISDHATMVTGSIASTGIRKEARGVAPAAEVYSHDWTRDKLEVVEAAANGLLLSNHSYGIMTDRVPDWYFGSYIKVAQDWDKIMYNAPYYLMVTAAGNAQKRGDNESPIFGDAAQGYDVLLGFTLAKNGITVAAANTEIDREGQLKKAQVSAYSSFGPVDDGRVKPDLAGDGSALVSTSAQSNSSYDTSSGTSMATPGVTGSLLLLQQYHEQLYGQFMKAATLKGLALHTADDVDAPGPDYTMGWGVLNAKRAAEALWNKDYSTLMNEDVLEEGETITFTVEALGEGPLSLSLSWTDPASEHLNRGVLNDTTKALVNDLDVRITKEGVTYYPYVLNPKHPSDAAVQGNNRVDPFERIDVPNAKGTYTVTISHKGILKEGHQAFSFLATGIKMNDCNLIAPKDLALKGAMEGSISLYFEGTSEALYEVQHAAVESDTWATQYVSEPTAVLGQLAPGTDYVVRVRTFCSQNVASEYTFEHRFTFNGSATQLGLLELRETLSHAGEAQIHLYPNPVVDVVNIQSKVGDTALYRVVSSSGVPLRFGKAKDAQINVADLASGLYIVQILDHGTSRTAKFYKY